MFLHPRRKCHRCRKGLESDHFFDTGRMLHARNEYEGKVAIARTRVTITTQMPNLWSKMLELLQDDEMRRVAEGGELRELEALETEWDSAQKQQDGLRPKQEETDESA